MSAGVVLVDDHLLLRLLLGDEPSGLRPDGAAIPVIELPSSIGLTSLRSLGWQMADLLASGARLNLLSLEALAAAEHLGAEICLATGDDNPPLRRAADHRGFALRLVGG